MSTATALWGWGYYVTEACSPIRQAGAVWARCFGPKYQRTIRESDTNIALFHLSHAIQHAYSSDEMKGGRALPLSWSDLIRDTSDYAGPHMAGTLIRAYPFLEKAVDPWGRPWVFQIEEIGRYTFTINGFNSVDIELTVGSLGSDGLQCDKIEGDYETKRKLCDDLIIIKRVRDIPPSRVPVDIPVRPRTKAEVFTVPPELWQ